MPFRGYLFLFGSLLVLSDCPYKFLKFITIASAATLCCVLHQLCVATPVSIIKRYYSTADDKQSKHDIKQYKLYYQIKVKLNLQYNILIQKKVTFTQNN